MSSFYLSGNLSVNLSVNCACQCACESARCCLSVCLCLLVLSVSADSLSDKLPGLGSQRNIVSSSKCHCSAYKYCDHRSNNKQVPITEMVLSLISVNNWNSTLCVCVSIGPSFRCQNSMCNCLALDFLNCADRSPKLCETIAGFVDTHTHNKNTHAPSCSHTKRNMGHTVHMHAEGAHPMQLQTPSCNVPYKFYFQH